MMIIILIINYPNNPRKWGHFGYFTGEVKGKAVNSAKPKVMGLKARKIITLRLAQADFNQKGVFTLFISIRTLGSSPGRHHFHVST